MQWFNGIHNHFIIEFSDDSAPESKEGTMCIGSITMWNFGRSRNLHYPIHTITAKEKDNAVSDLWEQYTEEIMMLEGNVVHINDEKVTIEYQPSANQAWQFWANNELTQSATYPSMFAKVHKNELAFIGGSLGNSKTDKWAVPTAESRERDLNVLNEYRLQLNTQNLSPDNYHRKELLFMADNGLRQIGNPRIGMYANLQRPEPLHLEVNNWEHILYVIYMEAVQKNQIDEFLKTLGNSVEMGGCSLKFIAAKIKEHYENQAKRSKKLSTRLIGAQAIALSRYSLRLIDAIKHKDDTDIQNIRFVVLSKICQAMRTVGTQMNSVYADKESINQLENACKFYFNLFSLFFKEYCNSTVWTIGYVVSFHAEKLWNQYNIGYVILSMQGKESKHSAIKQELKTCSNRSSSQDGKGKWHQLARGSFVRNFYLPYHFPVDSYVSHSDSRNPPMKGDVCGCFRFIDSGSMACDECLNDLSLVHDAMLGFVSNSVINILRPHICDKCGERFPYSTLLNSHQSEHASVVSVKVKLVPRNMKLSELKKELIKNNLSTIGSRAVLCERLETLEHL